MFRMISVVMSLVVLPISVFVSNSRLEGAEFKYEGRAVELNGTNVRGLSVKVLNRQGIVLNRSNVDFPDGNYGFTVEDNNIASTDQGVIVQFRSPGHLPVDVHSVHGLSNNEINVVMPVGEPVYKHIFSGKAVYRGSKSTHHLSGDLATSSYHLSGKYLLTRSELFASDENYLYYREIEQPDHQWAFARNMTHYAVRRGHHRISCYCAYRIWVRNGDEAKWRPYDWAQQRVPDNSDDLSPVLGPSIPNQ